MSSGSGATGKTEAKAKPVAQNEVDLSHLEEDDEFEEFEEEGWLKNTKHGAKKEEVKEVKDWQNNWDDDDLEDDFGVQLKAELEKQGKGSTDNGQPMQTN